MVLFLLIRTGAGLGAREFTSSVCLSPHERARDRDAHGGVGTLIVFSTDGSFQSMPPTGLAWLQHALQGSSAPCASTYNRGTDPARR